MKPLYNQLKVLSLKILIEIEQGKTMYKYCNNLLPEVFGDYFKTPAHHYRTRYAKINKNFEKMQITTNRDKSLLKFIGPKAWSEIPLQIKDSLSLKVFVNSYRNRLLGKW